MQTVTKQAAIPELPSVSYEGKISPNQPFNNYLYEDKKDYMLALFELLHSHAQHVNEYNFKLSEHSRVGFEEMSTPPMQLALLKFMINMNQSKKVLEIGTFIGNTAMHIAKFIGQGAHVVTIEKFSEFADIARKNFKDNNLSEPITLLQGDANVLMEDLEDNYFDLIYVDGDKGKYLELTKIAERKLSSKGIILVDDVFFHGDALNEHPRTDKGRGCKELLEHYKNPKGFSKYLLPMNNGILLLKRV
jgi:predicted O-methyltransferase YrrM